MNKKYMRSVVREVIASVQKKVWSKAHQGIFDIVAVGLNQLNMLGVITYEDQKEILTIIQYRIDKGFKIEY